MALRDYVTACISRWFASLVILRASEMHGYACGRVRVHRRWFCLECMVGRRVQEDRRVRLRTTSRAWGGGGEEGSSAWWQVVQSSARASRFARVPLQRRYGGSGAYAPLKRLSCVVSLTYACCRCDGFAVRVVTHDFACVGGGVGGGSFRLPVCVSCLCDRRCLCCVCMCVVAWMLVCVFYVLAICGYLWYLRTCMFAVR